MLHNFIIVGADTDGIAFRKQDHSRFTDTELNGILDQLNVQLDELIRFENDGVFPCQLNVRAKNYVLVDQFGKMKIKGSALKATSKEKALQRFIKDIIQLLVDSNQHLVHDLYMKYAREIVNLKDITDWCSKKTITKAILTNTRTNEKRVRDALKGRPVQEGEKIRVFFKSDTEVALCEDFDGTYDMKALLGKLYDTVCIFETVIPEIVKALPNLALKKHKGIVNGLRQVEESKVV